MAPADVAFHGDSTSTTRPKSSPSLSSLGGYGGLLSPPAAISPDPAFIAASAASQIVTSDEYDSHADAWPNQHAIEPYGETALVAPPALALVNKFLDQLLFNFLSVSKSTSLSSLRPAVAEVLRPKLSKDAIAGADQELLEYLGGGEEEEEEELVAHNGLEPSSEWDLEHVWKRTRLRCMVYSSLGDLEEEDEEREQLDGPPGFSNRLSNNPGVVSPAAAIFLTSILEYMGEQVLVVAGQAAYSRLRTKTEKEEKDASQTLADIVDRVVVEENDMERVALDRTLGRLWRGWKKRIRSPTPSVSHSRSFSRESLHSLLETNEFANGGLARDAIKVDGRRPSLAAVLAEIEYAALVPLPMSDDDVREIEIPGLAHYTHEEKTLSGEEEGIRLPSRPKSLVNFTHREQEPLETSTRALRKRSSSLPLAPPLFFAKRQKPSVDAAEQDNKSATVKPEHDEAETAKDLTATQLDNSYPAAEDQKGVDAGVPTGAVATSAANGEVPQTFFFDTKEPELEEVSVEEPRIVTSSRVSFSGRASPEDGKVTSSRHSTHSLRLIDVQSRKNSVGSRHSSVDPINDLGSPRSVIITRSSSAYSPAVSDEQTPRVGSPVLGGLTTSPIDHSGSSLSQRRARSSAGHSISEAEEDLSPALPTPRASQSVDLDDTPTSRTFTSTYDRPQPAAFVLAPAPMTKHALDVAGAPAPKFRSNLTVGSSTPGVENGVPPLTPLREMMEIARDTSDEYSSVAPSTDAQSIKDNVMHEHVRTPSTSTVPYYQPAPPPAVEEETSSRGPANYQPAPPSSVDQHTPNQVQPVTGRSSPPRSVAPEIPTRGARSLHTSRSSSSSGSHRMKAVRTSEDSGPKAVESKGQSFEQLIRSDQTIQYTLTPHNMREIEVGPESPRYYTPPMRLQDRPLTGRSHSSSVGKYTNGLNSPKDAAKSIGSNKSAFKPVSSPPPNTGSKLRPNAPEPRDARIDQDSTGDFAEFIRSTGPVNSFEPMPLTAPASANASTNVAPRFISSSGVPRTGSASSTPKRASSSAGRTKLQARDAVISRGDSVSDLIDFVRSGPQTEKQDHRIPRTIAPFKTSMDSDLMVGAIGGKAVDATLPDLHPSLGTSITSSVTSQSALLSNTRNKALSGQSPNPFEEEDMMPKRKTRRVRDIYAIDFSDEEDGDFFSSRPPPIVEEESLADFLRNVPPPPEPESVVSRPTSSKLKKKQSSTSLLSRFGRNNSTSGKSNITKPQSRGQEPTPASGARKTALYTPIAAKYSTTSPSAYDQPRTGSNYVSQLDSARGNRVAQKNYQPREAVYTPQSQTNALAEFLLSSEPASSVQAQPKTFAPTLQKEEASTFQRMFGRRKAAR